MTSLMPSLDPDPQLPELSDIALAMAAFCSGLLFALTFVTI